ncbi:MAG: peptidoglycan DD-metalloendopeptidase family protein, partial [Candidatus Omnitrophota bacterium]
GFESRFPLYNMTYRRFNIYLVILLVLYFSSGCSYKHYPPSKKVVSTGVFHTVKYGETLWRIGKTYGVSTNTLKKANRLKDDAIIVGQHLFIPGAKTVKKVPPATKTSPGTPPETESGPSKPPVLIVKPVPKTASETPYFSRPVSGKVISSPEQAEKENRMIFETAPGEPIKACGSGQTFFIGETKTYQNTLIIDHLNGYYSVYGGDIIITTEKGARITKETVVGKTSGEKEKPLLYFEVRQGTTPINPNSFLEQK